MRIVSIVIAGLLCIACIPEATAQLYEDDEEGQQECEYARDEAESAASDLALAASALQLCAGSEDYDDDCSSEMYRVQSAHSDYESAASEVSSYCDY